MPRVTVYVRNEDYSKWKSIKQKTEFMHKSLMGTSNLEVSETVEAEKPKALRPTIKVQQPPAIPKAIKRIDPSWTPCKHGFHPTMCKHARFDRTRNQKWCK